MEKMKQAIGLLEEILNDRGVPKNIKNSIEMSIDDMRKPGETDGVKISTVISILDDASNDPNISTYARTKVWDVVSKLEELNK